MLTTVSNLASPVAFLIQHIVCVYVGTCLCVFTCIYVGVQSECMHAEVRNQYLVSSSNALKLHLETRLLTEPGATDLLTWLANEPQGSAHFLCWC